MAANIVTCGRIVFSILMLFCPVFSPGFFGCYLAAGFTDMIDGTIARRMGTQSEFGAKLDTVADMVFAAAAAVKVIPMLQLDLWIWLWIGAIACGKVATILFGLLRQRRFVSEHTVANKVTGAMVFLLPLTMTMVEMRYGAVIVCAAATFAAAQEAYIVMHERHPN